MGVESIPDSLNQIRLGRSFLRNFYTILDFDKNYIVFGLNQGGNDGRAYIGAEQSQGFNIPIPIPKTRGGLLGFFLTIFLLCFAVYAYLYWKKKRDQKKTFAKTTLR